LFGKFTINKSACGITFAKNQRDVTVGIYTAKCGIGEGKAGGQEF
jgi:hypothetical protein